MGKKDKTKEEELKAEEAVANLAAGEDVPTPENGDETSGDEGDEGNIDMFAFD